MKVFLIGGTGLLGSECAKQLIDEGHEVTALALPPVPRRATPHSTNHIFECPLSPISAICFLTEKFFDKRTSCSAFH